MKKIELKRQLQQRDDHLVRVLDENDRLHKELRQWAEAQDSVRAEWLGIVEALGQIVPVIEGESTLTMIRRTAAKVVKAEKSLVAGGYTDLGGERWAPPLGLSPSARYEFEAMVLDLSPLQPAQGAEEWGMRLSHIAMKRIQQAESESACLRAERDMDRAWIDHLREAAEANGWHMMMAPLDQWIIAHLMAHGWEISKAEEYDRGDLTVCPYPGYPHHVWYPARHGGSVCGRCGKRYRAEKPTDA